MSNIFNLRSYIKFLSRNKAYTLIDVFGLSISLMFVILIGVYNLQERSTDQFNTKGDRIYAFGMKVGEDSFTGAHWILQEKLKNKYPDIESTCAVSFDSRNFQNDLGEKTIIDFFFVDSTFYKLFDFKLLSGDRNTVLSEPNAAVITEGLGRKLFHNANPIGKSLKVNDSISVVISGIMEPMEHTSLKRYNDKDIEMVVNFDLAKDINYSISKFETRMSNGTATEIFLLCRKGSDLKSKEKDMDSYIKEFFWIYSLPGLETHTELVKFSDLYFSSISSGHGNHVNGDKKLVNILFAVGLAILIFALMNYINLTVAQAGFRAKEMATRRLLGSSRTHIILRLILESTTLCLISCTIGIILSAVFAPYASSLLGTRILLSEAITPFSCIILFIIIMLLGCMAGILPALIISSNKPIDIVRGTFRRKTKMVFSKVFITFQNAITIIMIGVSLTMILQIRHLINAPLGYETDNIIEIECPDQGKVETFANELKTLSCVKMVSLNQGTPFDGGNNNTRIENGKTVSFQILRGDENYMKILGIEIEQDNKLMNEEGVYVNHQALNEMNLNNDAKEIIEKPIRGILKDFYLKDIESDQHPLIMFINKKVNYVMAILIKVVGDPKEALDQVKSVYKKVFEIDYNDDRPFLDQKVQDNYDSQIRLSKIMVLFTFIAIVISFLGLLAMSTYFIQNRKQEIALRKVFGSSSKEIMVKLIRTFLMYVLFAFIFAVPIIYYFMNKWLSEYTYRIELSWWIYAIAGFFCFLISLVAVLFQSYYAANANPVNSLKDN